MGLQELWFCIIAAMFVGFFVLEGFDFGVGMLMEPFAHVGIGDPETHRRAALNTIGPVWDGNEVWLITGGAAMFAAFPGWYATVFSTLYLPFAEAVRVGMVPVESGWLIGRNFDSVFEGLITGLDQRVDYIVLMTHWRNVQSVKMEVG